MSDLSYGTKSPIRNDRFLNSSPGDIFAKSPKGSPFSKSPLSRTAKAPPIVDEIHFDAPDVNDYFPSQLLDFNSGNTLAFALGSTVYLIENEEPTEFVTVDSTITAISWVNDDIAIASGGKVQIWDSTYNSFPKTTLPHHGTRCGALSYSTNRIAVGGANKTIYVTDIRTNTESPFSSHRAEISALKWSPDGCHLASGDVDGQVVIWGRKRRFFKHQSSIRGLAWSSNLTVAAADTNRSGLISVHSVNPAESEITGTTQSTVSSLLWHDRWGYIVGHREESTKWEIRNYELSQVAEYANSYNIFDMAVSTTGDYIASVSADEFVYLWSIKEGRARPLPKPTRSFSLSCSLR